MSTFDPALPDENPWNDPIMGGTGHAKPITPKDQV